MVVILRGVLVVFLMSQSFWPLTYVLGSSTALEHPLMMCGAGCLIIASVGYMLFKILPRNFKDGKGISRQRNWFYNMCCIFAWTCTFSGIMGFEALHYIKGFCDFYLENGEPHLQSSFGIGDSLWDQIVRFVMYLVIIYKFDNGHDYTKIGLYWAGDIIAGMFCLTVGALIGNYGKTITPATLMSIPYIVLPIYAVKYLLQVQEKRKSSVVDKTKRRQGLTFSSFLLFLGLVFSMIFAIVRGLAALGSPLPIVRHYVNEYEPYILEPGMFGAIHCLVNFLYLLPLQAICAYYLVKGHSGKAAENVSLVLSGAITHCCALYLMALFSNETPQEFRTTKNVESVIFLNLFPVVISNLLIYKFRSQNEVDHAVKSRKIK